ncbi:hypothetical protein E2K80_01370 [Rhodophyticola sp. CCM32]|nr:hypothetical protein E2K80_01370 [Rhodophyticola sp. CCM32]
MHEHGEVTSPRADAPEIDMPEGFWDVAKPQEPKAKKPVSLRVDPDILEFFKGQGNGHLTRMHSVLRAYVDAHKKAADDRHTP